MAGIFDSLSTITKNVKALPALKKGGKEALAAALKAGTGTAAQKVMEDPNMAKQIEKVQAMALEQGETAAAASVGEKFAAFWKKNRLAIVLGAVAFIGLGAWTIKRAFFKKK